MGKLTISMAIFNSYVKLPEATPILGNHHIFWGVSEMVDFSEGNGDISYRLCFGVRWE